MAFKLNKRDLAYCYYTCGYCDDDAVDGYLVDTCMTEFWADVMSTRCAKHKNDEFVSDDCLHQNIALWVYP